MIKKATLISFTVGTYTATVAISGTAVNVSGIPVSRNIAAAELTAGRTVAILLFDGTNPSDAVLFAVTA